MLLRFWIVILDSFYLKEVFDEFWLLYIRNFLLVVMYYWWMWVWVFLVLCIFWRYLFISLLVEFVEFKDFFFNGVDGGVLFFCDNILLWVCWCKSFFFVNVGEVNWLMYFGLFLLLFEFWCLIEEISILSYLLWLNLLYVLKIKFLLL